MGADSERTELEPPKSIESRYEIQRTLGQGAAGVVYQVRDRETGEKLALKKLLRMDLKSVMRLKHEFRALADLHHPNLVKLYDLGRASDAWFITMEHLQGQDLIAFLSQEYEITATAQRAAPVWQAANQQGEETPVAPHLQRVSGAFVQLARGIRALHRAGMLHRDLKPSNVMVAGERVVVLDFGLVREVGEHAATVTQDDTVAGTPAYMAPEQVQNTVLSEATDWYAFGVMLYEALSGSLPVSGTLYELLQHKVDRDPPSITQLVPQLPADVAALCMALLMRDPTARPSYDAIVEVLAPLGPGFDLITQADLTMEQLAPARHQMRPILVGRDRELVELEQALQCTSRGQLAIVHVRGPAGAGKSALVEQFLDDLDSDSRPDPVSSALTLRARCYEREVMPFKALDGLLDALVAYLARLDDQVMSRLLPSHLAELARAFPVVERVPAVKRLLANLHPRGDAVRERTRAELALQDLLRRVAQHKQLVLWIDDMQWGDLDSVAVLTSWLSAEEPLPLFIALSYRSDEHETNACLKLLTDAGARRTPESVVEAFVDLQPLAASDVRLMCEDVLGDHAPVDDALIERIVTEAQGSPFLARQLLTLAQARIDQGDPDVGKLGIEDFLSQVLALLSEPERMLLYVLAVAGRPLPPQLALRAAKIRKDGRSQLHALSGLSLTRMRMIHGQRSLEIYHHRVREALLAALPASERVAVQRRLLTVLELSGKADADWLYVVAVGAEQTAAALRYGHAAAQHAFATLAFERAADLYRQCLSMMTVDAAESGALWRQLGDALAACGRGSRAAEAYAEAAQRASAREAVELWRLAATHFIRTGHFDEGEVLVRRVLDAMQISVPQSEAGLLAAIAWERLQLAVRGHAFHVQAEADTDSERYRLASTYNSLSVDTQAYDPVRAALFQARSLRVALELGAPPLIIGALCTGATMRAVSGSPRDAEHSRMLLARARELVADTKQSPLSARLHGSQALCAYLLGRTSEALSHAIEAEKLYAAHADFGRELPGEYYVRATLRAMRIGALFQLGRLREASCELRAAVAAAEATDNRTALLHLSAVATLDDLMHGEAARARVRLERERMQMPTRSFGPLHLLHLVAVMRVGSALPDFAWADEVLADAWPRFEKSVVRDSVFGVLVYTAHARLRLNQYVLQGRKGDPKALIQDDLRALQKLLPRVGESALLRFKARLAHLTGASPRALTLYRQHIAACEKAESLDEAERGRWALGRVLGGVEGAALCKDALAGLHALGLVHPEVEVRTHFPEL